MNINQIIEKHALWLDTAGEEGSRANLTGADLRGADLTDANLTYANLTGADLPLANLTGAYLTCADLTGANLYSANLIRANLTRAKLIGAKLTGANLYGANLDSANLIRANLTRANLDSANLTGANLTGAKLYRAIGNLTHLKSIFCETYHVTYTAELMQIGCQRHKLEDWWNFDDASIIAMGGEEALNLWIIWKPILQQIIAASPATATGYVERDSVTKSG